MNTNFVAQADWDRLGSTLVTAVQDTLIMVIVTMLGAGILGLFIGILLYTTRPSGILKNRVVDTILNVLVNFIRPIPFIILLAFVQPITVSVIGTSIGRSRATLLMAIRAHSAPARLRQQPRRAVEHGESDAARAMGAGPCEIITAGTLARALGPPSPGCPACFNGVLHMSAMARSVAGGG